MKDASSIKALNLTELERETETKMASPTINNLIQSLLSQNLPPPHPAFLAPILNPPSSQRVPPLPALTATAKLRLLNSDLTSPNILDQSKAPAFPPSIGDVKVAEKVLGYDVVVQVLDVEDIGRSKWEQIESLESERKGESTKVRQVIRVLPTPADGEAPSTVATQAPGQQAAQIKSYGPFKLLLQDFKGVRVYGFELKKVEKIGLPGNGNGAMSIGCKILLRKGARMARGMVLLEPASTVVLGGKIEKLDKGWRDGREKSLREAVGDEK
jgi:RecQ-mediated genome instability protein 1